MLNKEIQEVRINVLEVLIESCKDNPENAYRQAQDYLEILQDSLQKHKDFYKRRAI